MTTNRNSKEERNEFIQDDGQLRVFIVPVDIMDVPDLTIYEQMLYMVLRSYANPTNPTAFPSYPTLARRGRMSRSSAIRAVDGLVQKGLITKEIRLDVSKNRKIKNTSNMYTLITPKQGSVSQTRGGSVSQTRGVVSEGNGGSVSQTPYHNHLKEPLLKDDDDNALTRDAINHLVFKEFKEQITVEQFAKVIQRIPANKKTIDYQAYLVKCVQSEIEELNRKESEQSAQQQVAATNQGSEAKRTRKPSSKGKTEIKTVSPADNQHAPEVDDAEFNEYIKLAQEIQQSKSDR